MPKQSYKILQRLKKGGQGVIYKCQDNKGNIRIMKILTLNQDDVGIDIQKSKKQGQVLSKLNHKNIIKSYQYFQDKFQDDKSGVIFPKALYIILQYMPFGDLEDYINKNSNISLNTILNFYSQLKQGLDYVHKQNIIHRDISPGNILLTNTLMPVITDFGIATETNGSKFNQTMFGHGKTMYRSKQILKQIVYKQSDYWALGVVMLELATGKDIYSIRSGCKISHPCEDQNFPEKQLAVLKNLNRNVQLIPLIRSLLKSNPLDRKLLNINQFMLSEVKIIIQPSKIEKQKIEEIIKQGNKNYGYKKSFLQDVEIDLSSDQKIKAYVKNRTFKIQIEPSLTQYFRDILSKILFNLANDYDCKIVSKQPLMYINFVPMTHMLQTRTRDKALYSKLQVRQLKKDYYKILQFLAQSYTYIEKRGV